MITVAVNNTLSSRTIPPGEFSIKKLSNGFQIVKNKPNFDYFNYAGILRPVNILFLPNLFIEEIKLIAEASGKTF